MGCQCHTVPDPIVDSHGDRYLGMTAAMTQAPVPTATTVNFCQRNHDRFLIIDDMVYLFGASLKDAGKKLFAYIKRQETPASELLNNIR